MGYAKGIQGNRDKVKECTRLGTFGPQLLLTFLGVMSRQARPISVDWIDLISSRSAEKKKKDLTIQN